MRAVVAYRGEVDGPAALRLAGVLRRTTDASLVVVAVLPRHQTSGTDRSDKEFRDFLAQTAAEASTSALAALPDAAFVRVAATSVAAGLVEAVSAEAADVLVLGCAEDAVTGNLVVGSVGHRLLHSSPVPILLAPHDYAPAPDACFTGLTCAYAGTDRSREALAAACDLAVRRSLRLRVATFVPRAATMHPPTVGFDAEDLVAAQWAEQAVDLQQDALSYAKTAGVDSVDLAVGRGDGWAGALAGLDWPAGEMMVFGSSRQGPLARVFLGSTAEKILRHTPVPVLVVPTGTTGWVGAGPL